MNVNGQGLDDAAVRALIERCAQEFRDTDADAVMGCRPEDVVCLDRHSRFEARGAVARRVLGLPRIATPGAEVAA